MSIFKKFKSLGTGLCGDTQAVSIKNLVGNPENWFSNAEAFTVEYVGVVWVV